MGGLGGLKAVEATELPTKEGESIEALPLSAMEKLGVIVTVGQSFCFSLMVWRVLMAQAWGPIEEG